MAVTITNDLIRSADTPPTAGLGGGGMDRDVAPRTRADRGPGRRHGDRRGGQPDPGWLRPGGARRRVLVPRGRPGRPVRRYRTRRPYPGIRGGRGRVMAWPVASYGVVAAGGPGGDEDEQA